ncbi:MAG TPA: hypothetical protein PK450_04635 [Paracoccaceae bacterium]|nr:hypothetical protein [Paracoccaceae bacterium]
MPEPTQDMRPSTGADLGRLHLSADPEPRFLPSDIVSIVAALLWLTLVGGFFLFATPGESGGSFSTIMALVAIFLPLALIWVVAATARASRAIRAEAQRLQATINSMQQTLAAQSTIGRPTVEKRLEEIATAARQTESAIATFTSRRDNEPAPVNTERKAALAAARPATEEQPTLALGTPAEAMTNPVSVEDLITALNFPDSPDDKEGIRALRAALEDRGLAKLIRAAQDVLTLLGQDGIYMDDLKPDRAKPDLWRRFANGERGKTIAGLGGVRDRSSLALTAGRMRQDTIFRDAAHHFLRQFDKTVAEFEKNASDKDLGALAETRTARAFMLLARVTGTFD